MRLKRTDVEIRINHKNIVFVRYFRHVINRTVNLYEMHLVFFLCFSVLRKEFYYNRFELYIDKRIIVLTFSIQICQSHPLFVYKFDYILTIYLFIFERFLEIQQE